MVRKGIIMNYTCLTLISYMALLFLIVPATTYGLVSAGIFIAFFVGFIVIKRPQIEKKQISRITVVAILCYAIFFGVLFFERWKVVLETYAEHENFINKFSVLLGAGAIVLSLASVYSLLHILQIFKILSKLAIEKKIFTRDIICCLIASCVTIFLSQFMIEI